MSATMPAVLKLYQRIVRWPFGRWVFSRAVITMWITDKRAH